MTNLMSLMERLTDGGYYVYKTDYNRIGAKAKDKFDLFERDEGEVVTPINRIVVSEDKLNISIVSMLEGKVVINPIQAEKVGLDKEIRSRKFRTQTIIKNGKANMENIELLVTEELCKEMVDQDVKMYVHYDKVEVEGKELIRVDLELKEIDIVGKHVCKIETKDILALAQSRDKKIAKLKVIKYFIDLDKKEKPEHESFMKGAYTEEQMELLKEHGIDRSGNYVGIKVEKEINESNFYIAKNISFQVKGQSNIPSVNAVIKKIDTGKNLNSIETYMCEVMNDIRDFTVDELIKIEKGTSERLNETKLGLSMVRMGKVLLDVEEFEGTDIDNKGNLTYTDDTGTLVIKISSEKIYN